MKKIIAITLAALTLSLGLTGCFTKDTGEKNTLKDGKKLSDVIMAVDAKFAEKYGEGAQSVMMRMELDDSYLTDIMGLTLADIEEKAGGYAGSMTNSDIFVAIKAKPDKIESIKTALEKRKVDLEAQYEFYNVMGSYDRVQAGEVYVKGDYAFLIVVGPAPEGEEAPNFGADVEMTKEVIDLMFH